MKFLRWLALPEPQEQQTQYQQPQVIYSYDPQQIYQQQYQPQQQYVQRGVSWKTFMLDQGTKGLMFRIFSGKKYISDLEECYMQLLEEKADSRLYDVSELLEKYNGLYHDYKALEVNLAVANAKLLHQNEQTEIALGMSTKAQKRNQVLKEHGYEEEKTEREKVDNKYVSANGNDGKTNQMMIAAMDAYGIPKDVISAELEIKKPSVVTIASSMKKEYMTVNNQEGFCIHFSEKFDRAVLNLDDMFADDWWRDEKGKAHPREDLPDDEETDDFDDFEEADDFEETTTGRGVIVKSIQKY